MGIFFAFWRRLFGGYDSKFNLLDYRGIQMILCIAVTFLFEFFYKGFPWWRALIIAVLVYIFWCRGHWYYFKCGTESDEYIDEELAKGRKPALNWIVAPINKCLGFKERSVQYCFVGLFVRYFFYSIPVAIATAQPSFSACAFTIPFIYNAMFWCKLPNCKYAGGPTNWAEIFEGLVIGWSLV